MADLVLKHSDYSKIVHAVYYDGSDESVVDVTDFVNSIQFSCVFELVICDERCLVVGTLHKGVFIRPNCWLMLRNGILFSFSHAYVKNVYLQLKGINEDGEMVFVDMSIEE